VSFFNPYYGILVWYWIAYFNPHRLAYSIHYYPVAEMIAIPTLIGLPFTANINRRIMTRETILLAILYLWFIASTLHASSLPLMAAHMATAWEKLINLGKILLITFVTVMLLTSKERLRWLWVVVALSFGLLTIKNTIFGFNTSGASRVYGPEGSFIADNNAFALATNMCLAAFVFLGREEERRWLKLLLYASFVCGIISVVLTYSRGGLLGLIAVMTYLLARSRHKLLNAGLLAAGVLAVLAFAPPAWQQRMDDLFNGKLDSSAQERLITWRTGLNIAAAYPVFGGGFDCFPDIAVYQHFQPEPLPNFHLSSGPHSIYIQMLGEHGYPGLLLFLGLIGSCELSLWGLRREARRCQVLRWIIPYTFMVEGGIIAFAVSGAFLEFANFDLWYLMVGMVAALKILGKNQYREWLRESSRLSQRVELPGSAEEAVIV
jgi:probable O-glycosylation ligase (exosortase A-associated)